jgi:hypothetical protein
MKLLTVLFSAVFTMMIAPQSVAGLCHVDTLTNLTPGDTWGCYYTFQNGDPSIPCAQGTVGQDGKVKFIKPYANFDNIEYFKVTGTGQNPNALTLLNPSGIPLYDSLLPNEVFPILGLSLTTLDVSTVIDVSTYNADNLGLSDAFFFGQELHFSNGANIDGYRSLSISGTSGDVTAYVVGFDRFTIPEPTTMALFILGLLGIGFGRTRNLA